MLLRVWIASKTFKAITYCNLLLSYINGKIFLFLVFNWLLVFFLFYYIINTIPFHTALFFVGRSNGNPAFSAVLKTSIPTDSIEGRDWYGYLQINFESLTTHSEQSLHGPA